MRYDVVVYGATGFTGQYIVRMMAKSPHFEGLTYAVAGRNKQKIMQSLNSISKKIGKDITDTPIILANCDDVNSVVEMVKQAKVLINAVGPYRLYGEVIVKACVENGACHLDISGEHDFLEEIAIKYDYMAKEKGVYVVGACGWDSIPCDLGVNFLKKNFDGDLNHVETFVQINRSKHGYAFNNGTYQTLLLFISEGKTAELKRNRRLLFPKELEKGTVKAPKRCPLSKVRDRIPGGCAIPFLGCDGSIVERSQYYLYQTRNERPIFCQFYVKTYMSLPNCVSGVLLLTWLGFFAIFAQFSPTRKLLKNHPDTASFGLFKANGPSEEQIKGSGFTYYFIGSGYKEKLPVHLQHEGQPDKKMVAICKGPDPGYVATAGCILSSALAILKDRAKLPEEGGVYTTASAFRDTNIYEYLESFNINFHVESTEDL